MHAMSTRSRGGPMTSSSAQAVASSSTPPVDQPSTQPVSLPIPTNEAQLPPANAAPAATAPSHQQGTAQVYSQQGEQHPLIEMNQILRNAFANGGEDFNFFNISLGGSTDYLHTMIKKDTFAGNPTFLNLKGMEYRVPKSTFMVAPFRYIMNPDIDKHYQFPSFLKAFLIHMRKFRLINAFFLTLDYSKLLDLVLCDAILIPLDGFCRITFGYSSSGGNVNSGECD